MAHIRMDVVPADSNKWMQEHMTAKYPLGDLKDIENAHIQ